MKIIHEDPVFVVVEKESGLLSVPGRGLEMRDSVADRVRRIFPESIKQPAVHRLDMDTSGLMVCALTAEAHRHLAMQFQEGAVNKKYVALVEGIVGGESGEIRLPFRLDISNRPHQIYDPVHGKTGITLWRKIGVEGRRTRIEYVPLTGRTHQIRVHSAHLLGLGCPVAGDRLYGDPGSAERLMLHASYLGFKHPAGGKNLEFRSTVPF